MASLNGRATPTVKVESVPSPGAPPDTIMKTDPDAFGASPSVVSDDDIYEDLEDFDFSGTVPNSWLMKMPKFIWDNWSNIKDDGEIQLGVVKVYNEDTPKERLTLTLNTASANKDLPRDYEVAFTNHVSRNLFVFTEKDFPKQDAKSKPAPGGPDPTGSKVKHGAIPNRLLQPDRDQGAASFKVDKDRRWRSSRKGRVKKQTAFSAKIIHELNCVPVENEEYKQLMERRTFQALQPKNQTKYEPGIHAVGTSGLGVGPSNTTGGLITISSKGAPIGRGKAAQEGKAHRLPRNELLDLLFGCFREYKYWSLKSLRQRLNQPEAYLKTVLDDIAILVKSGAFNMKYTLKPQYKDDNMANMANTSFEDSVGATGFDGTSDLPEEGDEGDDQDIINISDDDDENVKMEDVPL